jgi:glycosyltransferase involved in cell wall biosynthesis
MMDNSAGRCPVGQNTIAIGYNTCHYAVLLRSNLIKSLIEAGYFVYVLAPADNYVGQLQGLGAKHVDIPMSMNTNPITDVVLFSRFVDALRKIRPAVYLGYTIKPNVYGSLAANLLGIPVVNNIAGLGSSFIKQSWITTVVKGLYRLALRRSAKVFFQNDDDRRLFTMERLVRADRTDRLPGSGVDLAHFAFTPSPGRSEPSLTRFLLIARMLWDKGVGEFVEAARLLKQRGFKAEFCLLGFLDVQNPAAIPREQVEAWVSEGIVEYLGATDDVRPFIAAADCVVLPSYREGTSRTLLEAAAMGRPIVATDAVGCRDVVDDGISGYLCKPCNAADLAEKMIQMLGLSATERSGMGRRGRDKVVQEFNEAIVIRKYLDVVNEIVRGNV